MLRGTLLQWLGLIRETDNPWCVSRVEQGLQIQAIKPHGQSTSPLTLLHSSDFRLANTALPEKDIIDAMRAVQVYTGPITEFTTTADFRKFAICHGFFVELQDDPGNNLYSCFHSHPFSTLFF